MSLSPNISRKHKANDSDDDCVVWFYFFLLKFHVISPVTSVRPLPPDHPIHPR